MIFVTVGTHHDPFERLLDALSSLDRSELIVQYGSGRRPAGVAEAEPFMPFDRMLEHFRDAEKVITHAGVGSILCATRAGHTPLIAPRRRDLGEHVDEHQVELTRALQARGGVVGIWDMDELAALLSTAPSRDRDASPSADSPLFGAVSRALLDSA